MAMSRQETSTSEGRTQSGLRVPSIMNDETPKLIESATRGDAAAVQQLLEEHLPGLRDFIRQKAGRHLLAKEQSSDLVQSTCREILEHMDGFRYEDEVSFRKWLYTTALRKVIGRARYYQADKRDIGREVASPREGSDSEGFYGIQNLLTPSRFAMAREDQSRFEAAFKKLGGDYRAVIVLSRVAGLSHAEIAEKLGRSEGAVRVLLSRALARLATLVDIDES